MKIVAYLRVSTDKQAEEGLGIEIQRQGISQWAKAKGNRVVEWHTDEGVSGSNGLDERNGLPEALAALKAGRATGLVVWRLDRLARDLIVQETLLAELRRMGCEVFSTFPSEAEYMKDDPEDPSRKLIRQVLGAVSEYEKSMITLRLRAGRRRKAEQGGFAHGAPRFGKRAEGKLLVDDTGERAIIARIGELASKGESMRSISAILNSEGLPAKRGGPWYPHTVTRVVKRLPTSAS